MMRAMHRVQTSTPWDVELSIFREVDFAHSTFHERAERGPSIRQGVCLPRLRLSDEQQEQQNGLAGRYRRCRWNLYFGASSHHDHYWLRHVPVFRRDYACCDTELISHAD